MNRQILALSGSLIHVLQNIAWVLFLVLLPVTSFRYFPPAIGGGALVRPASIFPLLILLIIVTIPYLWKKSLSPTILSFLPFVLVALSSSLLSYLRGIQSDSSITIVERSTRALITLGIGGAIYLTIALVPLRFQDLRRSLRWIYTGMALALLWGSLQAIYIIYFYQPYFQILNQIQKQISIRRLFTSRISGLTYEPNWFAEQITMLLLPWLLASVLTGHSVFRWRRRWLTIEWLLLGWACIVLVFTFSRAGLIVMAVLLAASLLVFRPARGPSGSKQARWRLRSRAQHNTSLGAQTDEPPIPLPEAIPDSSHVPIETRADSSGAISGPVLSVAQGHVLGEAEGQVEPRATNGKLKKRSIHLNTFVRRVLEAGLVLIVLGGFIYAAGLRNDFFARIWGYWFQEKDLSLSDYFEYLGFGARFSYGGTALEIYKDNPLIGVGLGNYAFFFDQYLPDQPLAQTPEVLRLLTPDAERERLITPKNLYLRILAETGLVGFAAFLAFLLALVGCGVYMWLSDDAEVRYWGIASLLGLIAFAFAAFSFDSFALPNMWVIFGLTTAATWLTIHRDRENQAGPGFFGAGPGSFGAIPGSTEASSESIGDSFPNNPAQNAVNE